MFLDVLTVYLIRYKVECFGSFKTNTYLPTSDIDLVVINHRWCYLPLAELEQHFILTHQCRADKIRLLDRASVPIIKMTDCLTDIRINISFNMPQVVKSVNLVKVSHYSVLSFLFQH